MLSREADAVLARLEDAGHAAYAPWAGACATCCAGPCRTTGT